MTTEIVQPTVTVSDVGTDTTFTASEPLAKALREDATQNLHVALALLREPLQPADLTYEGLSELLSVLGSATEAAQIVQATTAVAPDEAATEGEKDD